MSQTDYGASTKTRLISFCNETHCIQSVFSPGFLFQIRLPDPTAKKRHKIERHIREKTTKR